jgi:hypothetical protein
VREAGDRNEREDRWSFWKSAAARRNPVTISCGVSPPAGPVAKKSILGSRFSTL